MIDTRGADLSRLVVLVPVAGLEEAKTRLGARLDAEERQALVLGLLDRTVRAADAVEAVAAVVAVSPDPIVLKAASAAGATPVRQPDRGLNEGLRAATRWAAADRASAILVLAGDLPGATEAAIQTVILPTCIDRPHFGIVTATIRSSYLSASLAGASLGRAGGTPAGAVGGWSSAPGRRCGPSGPRGAPPGACGFIGSTPPPS